MSGTGSRQWPISRVALRRFRRRRFMVLPLLAQGTASSRWCAGIFLIFTGALIVYLLVARTVQVGRIAGLALVPVALEGDWPLGVRSAYSFSIAFWAIELRQWVDTKVPAPPPRQIADPLLGHTGPRSPRPSCRASPTGCSCRLRRPEWMFMGAAQLPRVWPVASPLPQLTRVGERRFS